MKQQDKITTMTRLRPVTRRVVEAVAKARKWTLTQAAEHLVETHPETRKLYEETTATVRR